MRALIDPLLATTLAALLACTGLTPSRTDLAEPRDAPLAPAHGMEAPPAPTASALPVVAPAAAAVPLLAVPSVVVSSWTLAWTRPAAAAIRPPGAARPAATILRI